MALAIAASLVFGEYVAVLLASPARMVRHRVFAPLFAGPAATWRVTHGMDAAGSAVDEDADWQPER